MPTPTDEKNYMSAIGSSSAQPLDYVSVLGTPIANMALGIGTNIVQARLMRQNQKWQERMMERQNAYNDPVAQRFRAIRAGVAPNFSPQGAAGVDMVHQPVMSNPSLSGLQDAPSRLKQQDIESETLKQTRMATQRAGIDTKLYMQEKLTQLARSLVDLESKGLDNREARLRYDRLETEYHGLLDDYDNLRRITSNEADIGDVRVRGEERAIQRLDEDLKERIRHNKMEESISWFNAETSRRAQISQMHVNEAEEGRLRAATEKLNKEVHLLNATIPYDIQASKLRAITEGFNAQEKMQFALIAAIKYEFERRKSNSVISYLLQAGFGLDPDQVAQLATMIGIGTAAAGAMKAKAAANVDKMPKAPKDQLSFDDWIKNARTNGTFEQNAYRFGY